MPYNVPPWVPESPADLTGPLARSFQKALDSDVTPLTFDPENGTAEFEGRHGHYKASLAGCPCGSHPKPCKHMFRIALELGIMPRTPESDYDKVVCRQITHEANVTSSDIYAAIDSLAQDARILLHRIAKKCQSAPYGECSILFLRTPSAEQLLHLGFVDETVGDYQHCSFSITKKEIVSALTAAGLDAPPELFQRNSRWAGITSHFQSLYASFPKEMSATFVVLEGNAITRDKSTVIIRHLAQMWDYL